MLSYFQIIENKYSAAAQESVGKDCPASVSLDQSVDGTISQAATEGFAAWKRHDDAASDFCDLHGEKPPFVLLIFFRIASYCWFLVNLVAELIDP
jgi:hypothetical protein